MDRNEYKLKLDEIKSLNQRGWFQRAAEVCDEVNWDKVRNSNTLVMVANIYEEVGRPADCRRVLLKAYDHAPRGRNIIYKLTELAVRARDIPEAERFYREFVDVAPDDSMRFELQYLISCIKKEPLEKRIKILEDLKAGEEYTEKWLFELAACYAKADRRDRCVSTCDELILWFGDGEYVAKALDLKRRFAPLTPSQEEKYKEIHRHDKSSRNLHGQTARAAAEAVAEKAAAQGVDEAIFQATKFNTQNLQEELQKNMEKIMNATSTSDVDATMDSIKSLVGNVPYLSEPIAGKNMENTSDINRQVDEDLRQNFQGMLGTEGPAIDSQPTGNIEDVLAEWEKTKRAAEAAIASAEQQKFEISKQQALGEAGQIMDRLKTLIPILQARDGDVPYTEQSEIPVTPPVRQQDPTENLPSLEVSQEMIKEWQAETAAEMQAEEPQKVTETQPEEAQKVAETQPEEAQNVAETQAEEPQNVAEPEMHKMQPKTQEEPQLEHEPEQMTLGQINFDELVPEQKKGQDDDLMATRIVNYTEESLSDEIKEIDNDSPSSETKNFSTSNLEDILAASVFGDETAPLEEIPDGPVRVEEPLAFDAAVSDELSATGSLPRVEEEVRDELEDAMIEGHLDDEMRELFSYYLPVPGMEEQIGQVILGAKAHDVDRIDSKTGNIMIQGDEGSGKKTLAMSLIKAIKKATGKGDGPMAKISASTLNTKDFAAIVERVRGGFLMVEDAGQLTHETQTRMSEVMCGDTGGLTVILVDTKDGIREAMSKNFDFAQKFTEIINIPVFTIDELIEFAKSYAAELECSIDEMALMALCNCINNMQKTKSAVTFDDVKEIVDKAVDHAEGKGLKSLFGKKFDDDDFLILHEKDFEVQM